MRYDIQVMRGIAVLAVVIFHAFHGVFAKGFLGVDVFFVISGFLITGHILRQLEDDDFSFKAFYLSRARRLLPASLVTLAATSVMALLLLTPAELGDYAKQLIGALTFTANFALAQQVGYFEGAAEARPLLHIWSLSLEEQFYFIAPLLLWMTPRRWRFGLLLALTIGSGLLCAVLMSGIPIPHLLPSVASKIAFFMLPARAWELSIGGLAAWAMLRWPQFQVSRWAKYGALAVIVFCCGYGVSSVHPGPDALIVAVCTAVILMGQDGWLHRNPITDSIRNVGDWSYSLYLVHWPLFSFAFIVYLGQPPAPLMIGIGLVSIGLAWAQYRYVEQPFRTGRFSPSRRFWPAVGGAAGLLMALGLSSNSTAAPDPNLTPIPGIADGCDQGGSTWIDKPECKTGTSPSILLWGDSYAMHLVPGIQAVIGDRETLIQATKSTCTPTLGVARVNAEGRYNAIWAKECIAFNASVEARLRSLTTVRYVILSSYFGNVFTDEGQSLSIDGRISAWTRGVAKDRLTATVRAIQAAGKVPIIVGPTPGLGLDIGACNARRLAGRLVLGVESCDLPSPAVLAASNDLVSQLRAVGDETGAIVLIPADALCGPTLCATVADGKSIYRDSGHLTRSGSQLVLTRLHLGDLLNPGNATIQ